MRRLPSIKRVDPHAAMQYLGIAFGLGAILSAAIILILGLVIVPGKLLLWGNPGNFVPLWVLIPTFVLVGLNAALVRGLWQIGWVRPIAASAIITGGINVVSGALIRLQSGAGLDPSLAHQVIYLVIPIGIVLSMVGSWYVIRPQQTGTTSLGYQTLTAVSIGAGILFVLTSLEVGPVTLVGSVWLLGYGVYFLPAIVVGGLAATKRSAGAWNLVPLLLMSGLAIAVMATEQGGYGGTMLACGGHPYGRFYLLITESGRYGEMPIVVGYEDGCNGMGQRVDVSRSQIGIAGLLIGLGFLGTVTRGILRRFNGDLSNGMI